MLQLIFGQDFKLDLLMDCEISCCESRNSGLLEFKEIAHRIESKDD